MITLMELGLVALPAVFPVIPPLWQNPLKQQQQSPAWNLSNMKNQTLLLLVVAGGCGLVAMLGVQQYLAKKGQQKNTETVQVLVAAAPIKQGTPLNELNTKFIAVEQSMAPQGVVTELEQIQERALKVPRDPGDWILVEQLTAKGATGASAVIPNGMRVATINVDATTNHSGMLRPGNRIDLLLTYATKDPQTKERVEKVTPLLQYIEVFAVDDQVYGVTSGGDNKQARNISLLVDTEQMMKLQLAMKKGDLSTVLRSNDDKDEIDIQDLTEDSLEGRSRENINETSVVGFLDPLAEPQFSSPNDSDQTSMFGQLAASYESEDPIASENYWTMNIYEGGTVRRERVNLDSEDPLASGLTPAGENSSNPAASTPVLQGLNELSTGSETNGKPDGLEAAAAGLLELFN